MERTALFLTKDQLAFLRSLSGLSIAEHVRRAIDEYIQKHKPTAVTSPSKNTEVITSI